MEGRADSTVYLGEWDQWLRANGRADETRRHYAYAMLRLMSSHVGVHVLDIHAGQVHAFLASLGSKAHSKALYVRGFRSFYRHAVARKWIGPQDDPTILLDPRRPRRTKPQPFTAAEVRTLLEVAFARHERRGWAILACLGLGTRRGEFCRLRLDDIDWTHGRVHIRPETAKGNRERWIDISPIAARPLRELERWSNGTLVGVRPQTFTQWMNDAGRAAGFPPGRKRRAHTLRATYASLLDHAGVPTGVIQELLGHESLATTTHYIGVFPGDTARAAAHLQEELLGLGLDRVVAGWTTSAGLGDDALDRRKER